MREAPILWRERRYGAALTRAQELADRPNRSERDMREIVELRTIMRSLQREDMFSEF